MSSGLIQMSTGCTLKITKLIISKLLGNHWSYFCSKDNALNFVQSKPCKMFAATLQPFRPSKQKPMSHYYFTF